MEALNLQKNEMLNLTKATTSPLKVICAGAGWDMATDGSTIDIDLSAFALRDNKLVNNSDICFFGTKSILGGTIASSGDSRDGAGDGDDETIMVKLTELPSDVNKVVFVLNIYEADKKGQSFDGVSEAFVRIYNQETGEELAKTTLTNTAAGVTSIIFAELIDNGSEWSFKVIQETGKNDLNGLVAMYK